MQSPEQDVGRPAVDEADDPQLQESDDVDIQTHHQMPVATMLTPNEGSHLGTTNHAHPNAAPPTYFQSASGLVLPQANMMQAPQQQHPEANGSAVQQSTSGRDSLTARSPSRRSLPMGSPQTEHSGTEKSYGETLSAATNNWPGFGTTDQPAAFAQQPQKSQRRPGQSNRRVPTASPQMRDATAQPLNNTTEPPRTVTPAQSSPGMLAALQAQARRSPFQASGHERTDSRGSRRSQTQTPNATEQPLSHGFHPPATGPTTSNTRARNQGNDMAASSNYNMFGRHSGGSSDMNDPSSSRIGYEPYSHQRQHQAASYPSVDYRNVVTTSAPFYASTTTTSSADQWSGGSAHASRSYDKTGDYMATGSYGHGANAPSAQPQAPSSSLRSLNMATTAQQRPNSRVVNKQGGYPSFPSQQQPGAQPMGHQGDWPYMNTGNANSYPSNGSGWL